jgi:hypothetical protein
MSDACLETATQAWACDPGAQGCGAWARGKEPIGNREVPRARNQRHTCVAELNHAPNLQWD